MSNWTEIGAVTDANGSDVHVEVHRSGTVRLIGWEDAMEFDAGNRDQLRELLDRAAMAGQVPGDA